MTSSPAANWHVLGVGAIGSLWAGHLALAGHQVTLIFKTQARLFAYQQTGAKLTLRTPEQRQNSISIAACTADTLAAPCHNLLICTKSYDALEALLGLRSKIDSSTYLVPLLNGLGAQEEIAQHFPNNPVICATTTDGAYLSDAFEVTHAGRGSTHFGPFIQSVSDPGVQPPPQWFAALERLSLTTAWDSNIGQRLWQKLAVNAIINPITALRQCRNGEILRQEPLLIRDLCTEIAALMNALGIEEPQPSLHDTLIQVASNTAQNYSSMYQDLSAGRRTEIEQISGYLLCRADEISIDMPLTRRLYQQIKARPYHALA